MKITKSMADIRREYGLSTLDEKTVQPDPMVQFDNWFQEVLITETADPTAMVLSTVDAQGLPDSRVVLLKGTQEGGFVFYTNYESAKSLQLESTAYAALNFYWPAMARQVRIRGSVKRASAENSDAYFASRPLSSQYSTAISRQSQPLENRAVLEEKLQALMQQTSSVKRPDNWGGYIVIPDEYEFWQGRDSRLHDRIHYYRVEGRWEHRRLYP